MEPDQTDEDLRPEEVWALVLEQDQQEKLEDQAVVAEEIEEEWDLEDQSKGII